MADKTWKAAERALAGILGGERVPVTGRQRGSAPDIEHPWLSIECKHRKSLPAWMFDALAQAEASKRGDQLPIVILHESGQRYSDSLVVLRLSDFVDHFGGEKGETCQTKSRTRTSTTTMCASGLSSRRQR